ncbi:MAG: O-antigen ligase family protein, partial [Acidobacteria bacterium]|nr:O-antigen ligase family protein [Acidobacteriota bacterium]
KVRMELPLLALLIFIFAQLVCALFSEDISGSLKGVRDFWALASGFLAGFALSGETAKRADKFKMFLSISTALAFVMALAQFFFGTDFQKQRLFAQSGIASMPSKGFFTHHLTFAAVMGIIFLFFLSDLLNKRSNFSTYLALFSSFFGLILSQSRGYLLAVVVSACALLFKDNKKVMALFVISAVAVFSLFLMFSPSHIRERAFTLFSLKNGSFAERVYLFKSGLEMFEKKPLFGWGAGQYQKYSEDFRKPYEDKIAYPEGKGFRTKCHTHNIYLMVLIESGVLGFIAFILFLLAVFKNLVSLKAENRFAFLAPFVLFLTGGIFEYNLGDAEVVSLFAFLMGLSVALKRKNGL